MQLSLSPYLNNQTLPNKFNQYLTVSKELKLDELHKDPKKFTQLFRKLKKITIIQLESHTFNDGMMQFLFKIAQEKIEGFYHQPNPLISARQYFKFLCPVPDAELENIILQNPEKFTKLEKEIT